MSSRKAMQPDGRCDLAVYRIALSSQPCDSPAAAAAVNQILHIPYEPDWLQNYAKESATLRNCGP